MVFNATHRIIWLDAYIGQDGKYHSFKRMFTTAIDPNSQFDNGVDELICALNANAVPFIFVDEHEKAIHEIQINHDKQIIFISSGSLGQDIIPTISSTYSNVYSFYIFCAQPQNYMDFACNYLHCLKMFTSELDLLVRLVRDISFEMIQRGERHLIANDPERALDYFERSSTLETTANKTDKLNTPFFEHLRMLNGYKDEIGFIKKAENLREQQEKERNEQEAEPLLPNYDSQGQLQGIIYRNLGSPIAEQMLDDEEQESIGQNPDLTIAEEVSPWEQREEMDQNPDLLIVEEIIPVDQ